MDYPPVGGQATAKTPNNLLRKYQWHTIHNPRISLFGGEEEEVSEITSDVDARYIINVYSPYISNKFLEAFEIKDINHKKKRIKDLIIYSLKTMFTQNQYLKIKKHTVDADFLKGSLHVAEIRFNPGAFRTGIVFYLLVGKKLADGSIKAPYHKKRYAYGVKEETANSNSLSNIDKIIQNNEIILQLMDKRIEQSKEQLELLNARIEQMDELIKQKKTIDFNNEFIKSFPNIALNGTGLVVSALTAETGLSWAGVVMTADNLQADLVELYDKYKKIEEGDNPDPTKVYTFGGKLETEILGKEYGTYTLISTFISGMNAATGTLKLYTKGGTLIEKVDIVLDAAQTVKGASEIKIDTLWKK